MGMYFSIKICLIWKLCYEAKNKRQAIKFFFSHKDWQVFSWFSSEHFKYKEYQLTKDFKGHLISKCPILPKNERKQFDLRDHWSKVEFCETCQN